MKKKTRFLMIGGFLGAGKTTTIARLAKHYTEQGLQVGVVTNDQAYGLVDTEALRNQGFQVGEVPGACFCCKFDDLVETAAALGADSQPDIILTEPVGSCTDLMATVLRPLNHLFGDRYTLGPLAVLCKPEHGRKILSGSSGGFSPQAAYIFLKQLEEAQLIVLNKADRLSASEQSELLGLLRDRFTNKQILAASATTGAGFNAVIKALDITTLHTKHLSDSEPLDIDYDTYAAGEAALGWLNCGAQFTGGTSWPLDELARRLVEQFSESLTQADMEPGHVKVLASAQRATAVANWVASDTPAELSVASHLNVTVADVLVNVRVQGNPDQVAELVEAAITTVAASLCLTHSIAEVQHFRPSRPQPTHRYETSNG